MIPSDPTPGGARFETADAVVIGAGPNGLVAANLLAAAGWDVVVLEATSRIGGAVTAGDAMVPGFHSDRYSAFYPLAAASPALRELELDRYGLRWTHAPSVLAHVFDDGAAAVLHRQPAETAAALDSFAAGDGERWLRLYRQWAEIGDDVCAALLTPFPPVRAGVRLLRRLRTAQAMRLARTAMLPVRAFGEQTFAGAGARAMLTGLAMHVDLAPEGAGSAGYGWLLAMLGQHHGFPVPVGGAQRLADALAVRLRAYGGAVLRSAMVDRVLVAGGRAVGVRCHDGRLWRARRAVLADVPAPRLYGQLVAEGHLPARLLDDLGTFRWDQPTLKLDWALSGPVPWRDPAAAGAGAVHLGVDVDGFTDFAADLATGRIPGRPFVVAGQMTTADPGRSPGGTESMWAYTHLPARCGAGWPVAEADRHADLIDAAVERVAPGFRDLVTARRVSGPDQLERDEPSLVGGAIGGGTAGPDQQLCWRPLPGLGRADTPIDRLYLASASAHPGGGVHGACGANAARAAMARDRVLTGGLYATAVGRAYRAVCAGGDVRDARAVGAGAAPRPR
jgi:phytoene dehydrogenase-like protein